MKVIVLGCGSSTGVPMIGNDWGRCDPANPRNLRRRASIYVVQDETRILVDTSPDLRAQVLDAGIQSIDAVIYTHGHADHTHGIDDLRGFNHARDEPLNIFADRMTLESLGTRFGYAFHKRPAGQSWYLPSLIANAIDGPFSIGSLTIFPFEQMHGRVSSLGFRFGDFAYSTDVVGLSDDAFATLKGVDTWLVDCLSYSPRPGHAYLSMTLEWIKRLRPRRAILTHMSVDMDFETLRAELPPGVEPAYDGMEIFLPASSRGGATDGQ